MSKSNKNQKAITSFFKNSAQSSTNVPVAPKPIPSPVTETKEVKKEKENPEIPLPPPKPAPAPASTSVQTSVVTSTAPPSKPKVITTPHVTSHKQASHETEWINLSDRFLLKSRSFDVQYAHLYAERLGTMRKLVTAAAENRWGKFIQQEHLQ